MPKSNDFRSSLREWILTGVAPCPIDLAEAEGLTFAAGEQGLAGLLHSAIVAHGEGWASAVRERLRDAHWGALARGIRQLDLAARVLERLQSKGLRALPLKGAAVAERLYDTVADRPMADVDVLALDDWPSSVGALADAGLRIHDQADHAWSFLDPTSGDVVELHHSVTSCPGLFPQDAEGLWARSQVRKGQISRGPSCEDLLVHLSLHAAFQHGLVLTLVQYLDFRRLLERTPPDVGGLVEIARASEAQAAVAAALEVAARVVGAHLPPLLQAALAPWLPTGLRDFLRRADPLAFVAPAVPSLAHVRWGLAAGRRGELIWRTLSPEVPGDPASVLQRGIRTVARIGSLAGRWGWGV